MSPFTPAAIPSAGFTPVGAVLVMGSTDVHSVAAYPLKWTGAQDNVWDANSLASLPSGIGLTAAIDGTDATITTTTAGTWAFSYSLTIGGTANDYIGTFRDSLSGLAFLYLPTPNSLTPSFAATGLYTLPTAAAFAPRVDTVSVGAGTVVITATLVIVRLS